MKELKEVFEFPSGGNKPVRSQGSRWINHKRKALQRVVDRYGAYISHLTALAEDGSVKPDDRARLKGYLKKWSNYNTLVGCAMYVDILKPPSLLSLSLQDHELDTVLGIKNMLKSVTALKSLARQDPFEWPTVKLLLGRVKDEAGEKTYQGAALKNYRDTAQEALKRDALGDLTRLDDKMRERLQWSDIKLLCALLVFLETQSWSKRSLEHTDVAESDEDDSSDSSLDEVKKSVDYLATLFRLPLEAKGIALATLQDEAENVVEYARAYLDISRTPYPKVWYKLHSCPDARKWPSILGLCDLAFSLPFSNGRVEQIFSSLKVVKTIRRTNLQGDTLNDLLDIYIEGPTLSLFCPDRAIELWWSDCSTTRRVNQQPRKGFRPRNVNQDTADPESSQDDKEPEEHSTLELWDDWFDDDSELDTGNL